MPRFVNNMLEKNNKDLSEIISTIENKRSSFNESLKTKFFDEEGNLVIDLLLNKDNVYNTFSSEKQESLNPEIFEYISRSIEYTSYKRIVLNIITEIKNKKDRAEIVNLIQRHYYVNLIKARKKYKKEFRKAMTLLCLGAIILGVYLYLTISDNAFLSEITSIIGSFAIWESLDFFLLSRNDVKEEYRAAIDLLSAKIVFEDEKKSEE